MDARRLPTIEDVTYIVVHLPQLELRRIYNMHKLCFASFCGFLGSRCQF